MIKLVWKSALFVLPFVILHLVNERYYADTSNELERIGLIYSSARHAPDTAGVPKMYGELSNVFNRGEREFDYFIIGDSFTRQKRSGFQQKMGELMEGRVTTLTYQHSEMRSPFQELDNLLNGDFFDSVKVDYIILECVERMLIQRAVRFAPDSMTRTYSDVHAEFTRARTAVRRDPVQFFSGNTVKVPLTNLMYLFSDKPLWSQTYVTQIDRPLFMHEPTTLMFYEGELDERVWWENIESPEDSIVKCLKVLMDKADRRGIALYFLPAPDKFTVYRPYMLDDSYPATTPLLSNLEAMNHPRYLPTLSFIQSQIDQVPFYKFDNTHWSEAGSESVAEMVFLRAADLEGVRKD
ncbi:hypothetical protein [Phaeocystidibacter luteus]|uniref:AlgX/AlgJ SGNH hydrolase-like domain-containing protein n=1 Tax=Phaeocystidibacter luteus TaxID=911197 RepID=A0A6N6RHY2_9FLAO|nr:hypothetical protein [Phaeocystidibacter luteus]KAB2813945.1 hypothetical protein F8C67_04470 [Phaeocystidibacter luteus]